MTDLRAENRLLREMLWKMTTDAAVAHAAEPASACERDKGGACRKALDGDDICHRTGRCVLAEPASGEAVVYVDGRPVTVDRTKPSEHGSLAEALDMIDRGEYAELPSLGDSRRTTPPPSTQDAKELAREMVQIYHEVMDTGTRNEADARLRVMIAAALRQASAEATKAENEACEKAVQDILNREYVTDPAQTITLKNAIAAIRARIAPKGQS